MILDFQKLFSDIPSKIELDESIVAMPNPKEAENNHTVTQPQLDTTGVKETEKKIDSIECQKEETDTIITENKTGRGATVPLYSKIEEKTHKKLILFEESMLKFPSLMRQFYSTLPKTHEDGGLSVTEQGRVIHYGIKLETKVLELMDQYVAFIKQIGKMRVHSFK